MRNYNYNRYNKAIFHDDLWHGIFGLFIHPNGYEGHEGECWFAISIFSCVTKINEKME